MSKFSDRLSVFFAAMAGTLLVVAAMAVPQKLAWGAEGSCCCTGCGAATDCSTGNSSCTAGTQSDCKNAPKGTVCLVANPTSCYCRWVPNSQGILYCACNLGNPNDLGGGTGGGGN